MNGLFARSVVSLVFLVASLGVSAPILARTHGSHLHESASSASTVPLNGASATVAFSPNGDGVRVIVDAIRGARKQILVQAYGFSQTDIIRALSDAHDRGVDVRVILDKSNETARYTGATYLLHHRIPTFIDDTVAIAHNKVMVIDGTTVVTGSFNFTKAAQTRNAENVLVISGAPTLAARYAQDWDWRLQYSHPYTGPRIGRHERRGTEF